MEGMFLDIMDELRGNRVVRRADESVLIHFGNIEDSDDPRWQVVDPLVADELAEELERVCTRV